jgi:hypothetical protein
MLFAFVFVKFPGTFYPNLNLFAVLVTNCKFQAIKEALNKPNKQRKLRQNTYQQKSGIRPTRQTALV